MPPTAAIEAARGAPVAGAGIKRTQPTPGGARGGVTKPGAAKPVSKEEQEALDKRAAARARVAQRSAAFFGL